MRSVSVQSADAVERFASRDRAKIRLHGSPSEIQPLTVLIDVEEGIAHAFFDVLGRTAGKNSSHNEQHKRAIVPNHGLQRGFRVFAELFGQFLHGRSPPVSNGVRLAAERIEYSSNRARRGPEI